MHAVARLTPQTTDEEYYAALLAGQRHLHSYGVTGWQDAIVGAYAGMDDPGPTYLRAAREGDLTAHVVGALWWDRSRGEEQVAGPRRAPRAYTHGRFRATSVKIMQDGVAENFTAALLAPYLDRCGHATDNTGHSFVDPAACARYVALLDAVGFQVHVHAIGDRGVREALDAFGGTEPGQPPPHRAPAAGAPRRRRRFAELGVAANLQMLWACLDEQMVELTLPFLGEERAGWQYPFGDLQRAGARLVAGSDWPVSTPDPLAGDPRRGQPDGARPASREPPVPARSRRSTSRPRSRRTPRAGRGSTTATTRACCAPGAVADLVVLDRDPFAGPAEEIGADPGGVDLDRRRRRSTKHERQIRRIPSLNRPQAYRFRCRSLGSPHGRPDLQERHQRRARRQRLGGDLRRHRPDHGRGLRAGAAVRRRGRRPRVRRRRRGLRGLGLRHPAGPRPRCSRSPTPSRSASTRSTPSSARTPASRSG